MSEKKVWFVTGAGRGMGVDIAQAALAAGHAVVATGRDPERVSAAVGAHDDLLTVALDITDPASAQAAVDAAVERFGRIDVLVNNAGNFYAGFFEEITPEDFRAQIETNLFGPLNVTRAVLPGHARPARRARRDDQLHRRPDRAGVLLRLRRVEVRARGLDGVAGPRGRAVRHPHDGRRARASSAPTCSRPESTNYAEPSIDDYAERTRQTVTAWNGMNGRQGGDPAKLATALVRLVGAGRAAAALGRRRRRRPGRRAEGARPARPGGRPPGAVLLAGPRGRPRRPPEGGPCRYPSRQALPHRRRGGFAGWSQFDSDGMDRSSCEQL